MKRRRRRRKRKRKRKSRTTDPQPSRNATPLDWAGWHRGDIMTESIISGAAIKAKQAERDQLERDVEAFKANHGEVQYLKTGESGEPRVDIRPLKQRRKPSV